MKEIDEMARYLRTLVDGMKIDIDLQNRNKIFKIVFKEGLSIALSNDLRESYNRLLDFLKKKSIAKGKIISDKKIEELVIDSLINLHNKKQYSEVISNIHKEIRQLEQELTNLNLHQFLVIIPLVNLRIEDSFKIGYVELTDLTESKLKEISISYEIDAYISKKDNPHTIITQIQGHSKHATVAIVQVEANDQEEAIIIAIRMTDQALNILRFYLKPTPYVDFMISGEEPRETERTILIFDLTAKPAASKRNQICNMHDPEDKSSIDNSLISSMKDQGLGLLSNLVTLPENRISPLQGNILSAIYWIGNALKDEDVTDKFIKLMISLDILLAQGRQDKSEIIAKRYTTIINQNSSDDVIVGSYLRVKDWYSSRNKVMHSGMKFISTDLANQVRMAVCQLTYELLVLSSKYLTIEQLHEDEFPIREELFKTKN